MIWLYILLSIALTAAFIGYAYIIKADRSAFASATRTPARYMSDNIDHFVITPRLLYLKTISLALTPAVLLGVISVLMWGDVALILIPIVGIIFGGPLEFILAKIAIKNDGKKIEDLFDKIFGLIPGDLLRFIENLMKILMMIIMMYIPIMIAFDAWDISNLIAIPVVFMIFYHVILNTSYSRQRKFAMLASSGFMITTVLAILFVMINTSFIDGLNSGYAGKFELNSLTEITLAISFICLAVLSFRSIDNTSETTRHAKDQIYIYRMNAVNRATVVIGSMIWALITIAVINHSPIIASLNIMDGFATILAVVFGDLYKYVIALLGISIIFMIEYDAQRVRHFIIKLFKKERGRKEVKLKSAAIQTIVITGSVLLLSVLKWDSALFELIAFFNLALLVVYISTVFIYVFRIHGKLWSLIPLASVALFATFTALMLVRKITLGELEGSVELIFSVSMSLIITSLVVYRAYTLSSFVKLELEDYRGF